MSETERSPTVYGIETEYSCLITLPGNIEHELVGSCHSQDISLGLFQAPIQKGSDGITPRILSDALKKIGIYSNSSGMLSNGGRLYIDPSGPEYATAETSTAEDAVKRSFDGDEIILQVFDKLRDDEFINGFQLNRRIVDHNRTSRGIHLNHSINSDINLQELSVCSALSLLNVAKGAIFGSGGLLINEDGNTEFHHSPRLSVTNELSAHYKFYEDRPLVRFPTKADIGTSRIETVTSDTLNFAWPLRASLVITNALIKLIELNRNIDFGNLTDPVSAAHQVGHFGHEATFLISKDHKLDIKCAPLDVLYEICQEILLFDEKEDFLDSESRQVIPEIIEVADKIKNNPLSVINQVESIARKHAITKKMDETKLLIDSEKICKYDYFWDYLGGNGNAETLRKQKNFGGQGFKSGHSTIETRKRLTAPPKDTRARLRGELLLRTYGGNDSDWSRFDLGVDGSSKVQPLDSRGDF